MKTKIIEILADFSAKSIDDGLTTHLLSGYWFAEVAARIETELSPQQVGEEPFEMFKRPMPEGFRIDYISAPFLPKTRAVLLVHPDLIPPTP